MCSSLKTVHRTVFLTLRPSRVRIPTISSTMKKAATTKVVTAFLWLGNRDSNPNKQSQSLSCYRYTIPQRAKAIIYQQFPIVKSFLIIFLILKSFNYEFLIANYEFIPRSFLIKSFQYRLRLLLRILEAFRRSLYYRLCLK